jgi:hypothetical protein
MSGVKLAEKNLGILHPKQYGGGRFKIILQSWKH